MQIREENEKKSIQKRKRGSIRKKCKKSDTKIPKFGNEKTKKSETRTFEIHGYCEKCNAGISEKKRK